MSSIKFTHECHVFGKKYEEGSEADESTIDAKWLKGALKAGFVKRLESPAVEVPKQNAEEKTPAGGADVKADPPAAGLPKEVSDALIDALK